MRDVLVGRDAEVARLRGLVAGVVAGRGRSVWVEGEPGIGKSAVLAAGLAEARASGCEVFWEAADETRQQFPLWVLLDGLRVGSRSVDAARAEIAGLLRGEGVGRLMPGDVTQAVAERLLVLVERLCAVSPVVLVVDDLQWADAASLAAWGRLGQVVGQVPLLLVAAGRLVPARAELTALRENLVGGDAVVLALGALPPTRVTELVGRLVGAVPGPRLRVAAGQAGGNPLYVRELVDALVRERAVRIEAGVAELVDGVRGPESLAAAIAGLLGFLSPKAYEVLRLAALLGPAFTVQDLGALVGETADALGVVLGEAVAAGVLTRAGQRWVFRHGLIHQALVEALPVTSRRALHRQAAQALVGVGAAVERVAEHLLASPQEADGWTVGWVAEAAEVLVYRAPLIAVELLQRVRAVAGAADPRRERLDTALVTALFRLDRYEQVQQVARPALAATRDMAAAGRVAWTLGYALVRLGRDEQASAVAEETLRRRGLSGVWTARLRALQAMALNRIGRCGEAVPVAALAQAEGERAGDRLAVGCALHVLSTVQNWQERDDQAALALVDRALAVLGEEPETTDLRLMLLGNRATSLTLLGRAGEADRSLGKALALAEQTGMPQQVARTRYHAAQLWFHAGRWDDALAEIDAAADPLRADATLCLLVHGYGALIAVHRDDRAALRQHLQAVDHLDLTAYYNYTGGLRLAQVVAAERDGQPAQALALLRVGFDPTTIADLAELTELTTDILSYHVLPTMVRLALAVGDQTTAQAATDIGAADARQTPAPVKQADAEHCRGLLAADPTVLLAAAEAYHQLGYAVNRAQALEDAAVLLAQQGEATAARTAHTQAVDGYTTLGAAWDIRRADTRLRAHGIRRGARGSRGSHRRPVTGWHALTPTELTVAGMVAKGLSNPDIAAELFLSRRTVQTHVSHILTKLGAHSRVDIARAAAAHQPTPTTTADPPTPTT